MLLVLHTFHTIRTIIHRSKSIQITRSSIRILNWNEVVDVILFYYLLHSIVP